jgi:hypothetical protein
MSTLHIIGAVVFGAITVASGLLAAEELVRLSRKGSVRRTLSKPAAQRFRMCVLTTAVGGFFLAEMVGSFAVWATVGSIMTLIAVWTVWLTIRLRRRHA